MAPFPVKVNGIDIRTSEALYQACRFPQLPDVQRLIIDQLSPMTAKMKSKPFRDQSRPDFDEIRTDVMRWCLKVKLACNRESFSSLLLSTGDLAIVEQSHKDPFWGAIPDGDKLTGNNTLGNLLTELRNEMRSQPDRISSPVAPLQLNDFLLYGQKIEAVG